MFYLFLAVPPQVRPIPPEGPDGPLPHRIVSYEDVDDPWATV